MLLQRVSREEINKFAESYAERTANAEPVAKLCFELIKKGIDEKETEDFYNGAMAAFLALYPIINSNISTQASVLDALALSSGVVADLCQQAHNRSIAANN